MHQLYTVFLLYNYFDDIHQQIDWNKKQIGMEKAVVTVTH